MRSDFAWVCSYLMAKALTGKLPIPLILTGTAKKLKTFGWSRPPPKPLRRQTKFSALRPGMQVQGVTFGKMYLPREGGAPPTAVAPADHGVQTQWSDGRFLARR